MSAITDFEVTYGSALAANKFHRVVTATGEGADINKGGGSPVYLWYKNGEEAPVVEIQLLYDDELVPEGFTKVAKDLIKGTDRHVYLCYRRQVPEDTALPIIDVRILAAEASEEGFEKFDRPVNRTDLCIFVKRLDPAAAEAAKTEGPRWAPSQLKVGDWFDCKDSYEQWQIAKVVAITESGLSVTYKGLSKYYDEVVPKSLARAAELGTHTSGSTVYAMQGTSMVDKLDAFVSMAARVDQFIGGTMPPEELDQFVKADLPNLLELALSSRCGAGLADGVYNFMRKAIEFVVFQLRNPAALDRKTVQMFERIMLADDNCNFFVCTYGAVRPTQAEAEGVDGKFMSLPEGGASRYYVGSVNYFGELDGFELLIKRLDQRDPMIPMTEAASYMDVLWVCKFCSTKFMIEDVFPRFRRALFDRIKEMTDLELRDVDRNMFGTVMQKLEELLRTVMKRHRGVTTENADETMESMALVIAHRMLVCPYMSLRLKGLSDIKDMLERVEQRTAPAAARPAAGMNAYTRGNITYYGYNMVQVIKPTVWLTAERFAAWLVEFKVIEVCLGERVNDRVFDVHLEGLKRLPTIVKFLAQQGLLSLPHLRRFWKISTEMGDTIKRAVFDVLASAAKYLTEEHFDALFEAIGAVTVADIDAPLLTLITTLTKHALVAAADPSKTYGVELLWKAVSAPAGLQEDVVVQAEKSFIDMFQQRPDLVQPYAERCGRNIQEQVSVVKSLKLLVELLKTLPVVAQSRRAAGPAASGEFASQETAVSHLLHTLDIASVVVKDLQAYKAAAVEAAGKAGLPVPSPDSTGGEALVLLKPDTHLSAIKARLDFLGFVYSTADVVPADDTLDILWTELVLRNVTAAEREAFFEWLKAIIEQSSLRAAVDGPNHVDTWFGRYFANPAQLRTSSLGLQGFAAFEAAFRAVNVNGNKLRASAVVMVFDSDLLGLDALWSVAVEALNPDVFKLAVELLIALHTKLSPQLTVNKRAVWEAFVVKCMTFVQRALVQLQAGAATPQEQLLYERHIEAALGLLQRFLSVVEDAGRKSREGYSVPWTITYSYRDGDVTKTIYLPENPTVGQVRTEAAAKIQFTPDRCRVQSKDRKSHYSCEEWDDKYYEATGMSAGTATCMPCVSPMVDTEQYDESRIFPKADMTDLDRTRPRELLSNTPEYFEALFEVLSLKRDSVVASSWSLIQLLPNNDRVMHSITAVQAAEATDLAALLNPSAPLKLLYTLRIVDKFVNPPAKDTAEEKAAAKDWCTAFAAKGGVTHLLKVFETCDIDGWLQSTLPQTCLSLLVKIIVAFLAPDRRADTIAALADVNAEAVTHRLFRAVEAAVRAAAVSVKRSDDDDGGVFEVKDEGALALAKKKKTKGRDAGTGGGDLDDDDPLELKESTEDEPSTDTFSSTDGLLESKLAPSTRESQLVQHSLALYSILALAVDAVRPVFVSEGVSQTLLAGLLKVPDVALRVEVEKGLSQLVAGLVLRGGSVAERDRFLQLLISNIDTAYNFDGSCTEFFSLLSRLLKLKPDVPPALDVSALLARLSELTSVHPILEVTVEQEDFLFRGLLCATASLLNAYPKLKDSATGLVTEVFHNCLFAVPTATTPRDSPPPKCKHATSRKIAFAFLEELAKGCPANMALLCEQMTPHHASPAVTVSKKGYSLPALPKSSTGYVGLKNLGCICYMNATVQNFFMVPEFRQGVLSYDDTEEDKKESLMFQLQRMFAFLQETDKQCYNPKGFCHAFKDWEGNPTNTFVQKDASEFLGMLFQQMEMMLQGSPQEHVLKQCFGGTHQNELIADGKYSAREEPFTFLSVDIKNKKDLYSALRGFISGETVDYKWENEDGSKVELPTQKRTSIKTPPQHLIVHLKRFEFDYETMQNSKLNDRFEFPRELDLWEFTAAGRPDKVARPEAKEEEVKEEEAVLAVPEDRDDFKYELAGVVIHSGTAHAGHYYSFIRERVGKLGRWMMFNDSSVTPFNPDYLEREAFGGVETYKYAYTGVTQQHSITRNAFILFYDRVPKEAVAAAPEAPLIGTEPAPHGAVGVTFVESLLALLPSAAAQWTKNSQYFSLLGSLCATSGSAPSPPAVVQYLKQRGLISILVGFYLDGESPIPKYNVSPAADVAETAAATQAAANRAMWDAMDGIRVTGNRHETYTTTYSSGAVVTYPRKGKMGNAYYAADFRPVLACIKELVLSSLPPSGAPSALQLPPAQPLSPDDVTMLSSNQFLTKLLSTDAAGTVPIARSLISHIVWNNEELSARIAGVIQAGIVAADGEAIVPWFKALGELFAIQDDLKDARLSALLGGVVAAMHSQQNYYRATETSIIQFVALGKHNTLFRQWVWANKASARWMLDWLRTNVRPPAYYQPGPMKLNKVQQTYFGAGAEPTLRTPALTERMAALLDGRAVTYADFDPLDDQDSIVGKRIAILLATHKWYLGRVDLYDPTTGKHVVRFDDKDVVAYNLHGKTVYKFVREGIQLNPWYAPPATDEAPFTVVVPAVAPAVAGEPPAAASQPDEEEELEPGQEEEEEDEQQLGYRHTYHQQGVVEEVSSDEGAFDDQEDRNDP